jgi:CDGSH-type Zn-finger protein
MSEPITIRCRENGPLVVQGAVRVVDHLGNEIPLPQGKEMVALCRCGHSQTKPFCDGNHKKVNFQGNDCAKGIG